MIDTLFQIKRKVEAHVSAPLLRERESFLSKKQSEGNGLRSLQMTADQLLFATLHLPLTNETVMVDLSNILAMQRDYDGPKSTFLVSTVVQWLENMGLLDQRFGDQSIMFNRFSSVCHYRMRYLAYPFYEERLSYLKDLESRGMSFSRLHEYAWMQLVIIDRLRLNRQDRIYESDVENVIKDRIAEDCSKGCIPSQKWIKTFRAVAYGWLSYAGILHKKQESEPLEHMVVHQYLLWARDCKGLAFSTLDGRKRELKCFMSFIQSKNDLPSLSLERVDEYLRYRHNCGCGRRSMATIVTTLRDFLRYAVTNNLCSIVPDAIKSPRRFSLETLPSAPSWDDTERLVGYYGNSDVRGKRNTAIMALMTVYGLRSSEVANLRLHDVDWDKDIIYIRRAKRGGMQAFPLDRTVAGLLSDYLLNGRKNTMGREHLFLALCMPYEAITRGVVYNLVASAYKGLDIKIRHRGGHSLRHACASHLVNNGGTLKDASDLLGHRLFDTTRIYAKVDLKRLHEVAKMDWEGLL